MKKTIRLNEADLRNMIMEAINELDWKTYQNAANKSSKSDYKRMIKFRKAAEDSFNKEFGSENTHLKSISSPYNEYDYSGIEMTKPNGKRYWNYKGGVGTYTEPYDDIFNHEYKMKDNPWREEWDNANNELQHYKHGDYEYRNGEGWKLKDEDLAESVRRTLRKYLR